MRRVLIPLLIVAGITAVVLAIGISRGKDRSPKVLDAFFSHTFEGALFGGPGDYVSIEFFQNVGPERYAIFCKRWTYQLGSYMGIMEQTRRDGDDPNTLVFDLRLAFEKGEADAEARLVRLDGRWVVDRIWLDLPEEYEIEPNRRPIEFRTRESLQAFFLKRPSVLWNDMGVDAQKRYGTLSDFRALAEGFEEQIGPWIESEKIGEITGDAPGEAHVVYKTKHERGHIDIDVHWAWHDVFWYVDRIEFDVHPDP